MGSKQRPAGGQVWGHTLYVLHTSLPQPLTLSLLGSLSVEWTLYICLLFIRVKQLRQAFHYFNKSAAVEVNAGPYFQPSPPFASL